MKLIGLDAIRSLAIILVICCHYMTMQHPQVNPKFWDFLGPFGVQLFFSLSGFLIGRILIDLADRPNLSIWLRFMARRWLRTLPLYWVILSILILLSSDGSDMHRDYVKLFTLSQNLASTPTGTFGVAWSLAVEEIFYLIFSMVMFIGARLVGRRAIWVTAMIFLFVPMLARCWLEVHEHEYPARTVILSLDGIAWGVVLSLIYQKKVITLVGSKAFLVGSVILISMAYVGIWKPINFSLLAIGCTLLVIPALRCGEFQNIKKPFEIIARYSYGTYLIHVPTILIVGSIENESIRIFVYLTMLATFVYGFNILVEIPFMKVRPSQSR